MLKIYICPKCYNFRMVSRKPDAICLHCGVNLELSDLEYGIYTNMSEDARIKYKDDFKRRILKYREKLIRINSLNNVD